MNGVTTLILKEMIKRVESCRSELERAPDLRGVTVTVTLKQGIVPAKVRRTTCTVERGDA